MGLLFKATYSIFLSFLIILSLFFSAEKASAQIKRHLPEESIELPARKVNTIMGSLLDSITSKRINLFAHYLEPEKEAALVLLSVATKSNSLHYLMTQAPREAMIELVRAGIRIAPIVINPGISAIWEVAKKEIEEDLVEWLVQNEIRVGGGELSISSYLSYDNKRESLSFPYILTHHPQNDKIEIRIYSPHNLKPPKSVGTFGSYDVQGGAFWNENEWLKRGEEFLPPFTVRIEGRIEKRGEGYLWRDGPRFEIDFDSPVPNFKFERLSLVEREILSLNKRLMAIRNASNLVRGSILKARERVGTTVQSGWRELISELSRIFNLGGAAVSSLFLSPPDDRVKVVSLEEEISRIRDNAKRDNPQEEELKNLKQTIVNLEKELEETRRELNSEREEVIAEEKTEEMTEIQELISRVDINSGAKEDLMKIIHIGPARADRIIGLRPFSSLDDLIRVPGIGLRIIADIKAQGIAFVSFVEKDARLVQETKPKEKTDRINQPINNPCLAGGKVDINQASAEDLAFLTGVGPAIAQRIITFRQLTPFTSVADLDKVSGIGPTVLQRIKEQNCAVVIGGLPRGTTGPLGTAGPLTPAQGAVSPPVNNPCLAGKVDINRASVEDLDFLTGIGPVIAQRIVDFRQRTPFTSVADLDKVSGIGPTVLQRIKEQNCAVVLENNPSPPTLQETEIELSQRELSFNWEIGKEAPPSQLLEIQNSGDNPLSWTIESEKEWLLFDIREGTILPKATSTVSLSINSDWLEKATTTTLATTTVLIRGNHRNSPSEIMVSVNILPSPRLAQNIIISEVQIKEKEFIELYNPTEEGIDVVNWQISYFSANREWNNPHRSWRFVTSTIIAAKNYFLIGVQGYPEESGDPNSDWELRTAQGNPHLAGQLGNRAGAVALFNCDPKGGGIGCKIDAVGWGGALVKEGESAEVPEENEALTRRRNSQGQYFDNDNNQIDFIMATSTPTNSRGGKKGKKISPPSPSPTLTVLIEGEDEEGFHVDFIRNTVINNGLIYFIGRLTTDNITREGLFSYDTDGKFRWLYSGPSRSAHSFNTITILPDNGILVTYTIGHLEIYLKNIGTDGKIRWMRKISGWSPSQLVVSEDNLIYFPLVGVNEVLGKLLVLNGSDGEIVQEHPLPGRINPVLANNGFVYFSFRNTLYSLSPVGTIQKKVFNHLGPREIQPHLSTLVIFQDTIYLFVEGEVEINGLLRDSIYALDLNLEKKWIKENFFTNLIGGPIVNQRGDIFALEFHNGLFRHILFYGLNSEGKTLWGQSPFFFQSTGISPSVVIGENNSLYFFLSESGFLGAINNEGKVKWPQIRSGERIGHLLIDNNSLYLAGLRKIYLIK